MYDFDIDLTPQKRSFRHSREVYSIVLESCWWQELEAICPNQDTLRGWILEWIQDARDKDCNRHALIRCRIHQLRLENVQEERAVELPALARMIGLPEAREHRCPIEGVKAIYCKANRCSHWQQDDRLRGFGKCKRLAEILGG